MEDRLNPSQRTIFGYRVRLISLTLRASATKSLPGLPLQMRRCYALSLADPLRPWSPSGFHHPRCSGVSSASTSLPGGAGRKPSACLYAASWPTRIQRRLVERARLLPVIPQWPSLVYVSGVIPPPSGCSDGEVPYKRPDRGGQDA